MNINEPLPKTCFLTTVKNIQAGAIFSRDWAPLHSDQDWAKNKGKLPGIIMNNYTFNRLIIKYITDHFGPSARIGKVKFNIKKPICPNKKLEFHGKFINEDKISNQKSIIKVEINVKISNQIFASAKVTAGIDLSDKNINSPWKIDSETWKSYLAD
jgi:acyl dehydratase